MKRSVAAAALAVLVLVAVPAAQAGPFDKLKKKVQAKVEEKSDQATDKAVNAADPTAPKSGDATSEAPASTPAEGSAKGDKPAGSGSVASVSTKFDFVPGDKVLFLEDFTQDELGEFPARWSLKEGTFEVAELKGERWVRCVSDQGHIRMKMPAGLPEFWTLEFDYYDNANGGAIGIDATAVTQDEHEVWQMRFPYSGNYVNLTCGTINSMTALETEVLGRHHVMFMARGNALKVYFDNQRVANVPDISAAGVPVTFDFRLGSPGKPMMTNVRFAEGCRPPKDMLAEGKLVTYGIHFATGSDVVEADSAPVLRQVAAYLTSKPDVKLRITGHTDNVGKSPANLDLSKRRAAAVASVLEGQFGVEAARLQADGKGDAEPLSSNAKPEGRAMNRRVEFAKL